jgi:hypothetical protein
LLSYSRISQHFMELEGLLSSLQEPSVEWLQYIQPHTLSLRSTLILSNHLRLGHPSGLFPSGFATKNVLSFFFSPIRATSAAFLVLLDLTILIIFGEE